MIKLYHASKTRGARIIWLLEELGVPYELVPMQFTPDVLRSPDFLRLHPLGQLPVMTDGDVSMFESGAMVQYLLEKHGGGRLEAAIGTPARAKYLQWFHFGEATLMPPIGNFAQHAMFKPKEERIPAVVEEAKVKIGERLAVLDCALHGKNYLLGDDFSAADIMVGYGLMLCSFFGLIADTTHNLKPYMDRLAARPAFQKAVA